MKRYAATLACAALFATNLIVPALATTDTGAYAQHETMCLGLLFSDHKAHAAECGPFTAPPFTFPTGGSGPGTGAGCPTGAIELALPSRPILAAGPIDPCAPPNPCGSLQNAFPDDGLVPFVDKSRRTVILTACQ